MTIKTLTVDELLRGIEKANQELSACEYEMSHPKCTDLGYRLGLEIWYADQAAKRDDCLEKLAQVLQVAA